MGEYGRTEIGKGQEKRKEGKLDEGIKYLVAQPEKER